VAQTQLLLSAQDGGWKRKKKQHHHCLIAIRVELLIVIGVVSSLMKLHTSLLITLLGILLCTLFSISWLGIGIRRQNTTSFIALVHVRAAIPTANFRERREEVISGIPKALERSTQQIRWKVKRFQFRVKVRQFVT
jgi:hypothetical protein